MKTKINFSIYLVLILFSLSGCKKFLDEKSDKKLLVATTLPQLQSLLDDYTYVNSSYCAAGEISADNYYLTNEDYNSLSTDYDKRMYIWAKDDLFDLGTTGNEWDNTYKVIYRSNAVLEQLDKIDRSAVNQSTWANIRGQALLIRGAKLLDASYIWAMAYDPSSAATDMGLPIRLNTDFNQRSVRATLQQTYARIISDLKSAVSLLPASQITIYRPSKTAAYGLLARAYLFMSDYKNAGLYADSCLQLSDKLIDYSSLSPSAAYPIANSNIELLYYNSQTFSYTLYTSTPKIDSALYRSYDVNDLRREVFFSNNSDGTRSFKGNYSGSYSLFCGVATDEMYLIRAESFARAGRIADAMNDLNNLLVNRWKKDKATGKTLYVSQTATGKKDALDRIFSERRKELLMRGLRWPDIKRLNKEGANISITRNVRGTVFTLAPNDLRFALPIPEDVIAQSSIPQNPR